MHIHAHQYAHAHTHARSTLERTVTDHAVMAIFLMSCSRTYALSKLAFTLTSAHLILKLTSITMLLMKKSPQIGARRMDRFSEKEKLHLVIETLKL